MLASFEGTNEYNTAEVCLVKKRDKLKQKPQVLDEAMTSGE